MNTWQLQDSEQIIIGNESLINHKHLLVGITRIRNEALSPKRHIGLRW